MKAEARTLEQLEAARDQRAKRLQAQRLARVLDRLAAARQEKGVQTYIADLETKLVEKRLQVRRTQAQLTRFCSWVSGGR